MVELMVLLWLRKPQNSIVGLVWGFFCVLCLFPRPKLVVEEGVHCMFSALFICVPPCSVYE